MNKVEINNRKKIALGGGCHWCTEAVFQSLNGVVSVEQGFVASVGLDFTFSEAVIIHYDSALINLKDLIEIHLHTHKSTSNHSFRTKYRSAVYTYCKTQAEEAKQILDDLQKDFNNLLVTKVYPFRSFKPTKEEYVNYYFSNPKKPFCKKFIAPKLKLLLKKFPKKLTSTNLMELVVS